MTIVEDLARFLGSGLKTDSSTAANFLKTGSTINNFIKAIEKIINARINSISWSTLVHNPITDWIQDQLIDNLDNLVNSPITSWVEDNLIGAIPTILENNFVVANIQNICSNLHDWFFSTTTSLFNKITKHFRGEDGWA